MSVPIYENKLGLYIYDSKFPDVITNSMPGAGNTLSGQ